MEYTASNADQPSAVNAKDLGVPNSEQRTAKRPDQPPIMTALFITLEGGEGSGKSTHARLLAGRLRAAGHDVCLTQEPAGTAVGKLIKAVFERRATGAGPAITPFAELFLFEAARADHVRTVIRPALEAGRIVVCDRFTDSTLAYQGHGRGLPLDEVRRLNHIASEDLTPDLTLLLDLPPEAGLARANATHETGAKQRDALGEETIDFHRRVREGFLAIPREETARVAIIDATRPEPAVAEAVWTAVQRLLPPP